MSISTISTLLQGKGTMETFWILYQDSEHFSAPVPTATQAAVVRCHSSLACPGYCAQNQQVQCQAMPDCIESHSTEAYHSRTSVSEGREARKDSKASKTTLTCPKMDQVGESEIRVNAEATLQADQVSTLQNQLHRADSLRSETSSEILCSNRCA